MVPLDQPSSPICALLLLEPVEKSSRMAKTLASLGSKSRLPLASTASKSRGITAPATEDVATGGADHEAALLLVAASTLPLAGVPLTATPLRFCTFRLGTTVVLLMVKGAVPVVTSDWMRLPASITPPAPTFSCNVPLPVAERNACALAPPPKPRLNTPLRTSLKYHGPEVPPPALAWS